MWLSERERRKRYVEGAVISALRLYRHWKKRGVGSNEAFTRAVKQAVGMIEASGMSRDEVRESLEELKNIVNAILKALDEGGGAGRDDSQA